MSVTSVLLLENMCDGRLSADAMRAISPRAFDANLTNDNSFAAIASRTLNATGGRLLLMCLGSADRSNSRLLDLLRDMGLALGRSVYVLQSEALRLRHHCRPALRSMCLPALYGCRMEDALCPPGWHHDWSTATPASRLALVVGAGHMKPLEHPDATAGMIDQWIPGNREGLYV